MKFARIGWQACCLGLLALAPRPALPSVVEFYNPDLDHYFITADPVEQTMVDSGVVGRWQRTGSTFESGGTTPVCRFYGSAHGPNSHFYTVNAQECNSLKSLYDPKIKSWKFESLDFLSSAPLEGGCTPDQRPVYRAYNDGYAKGIDSNHRITAYLADIQAVVAKGWKSEGVVMCAPRVNVACTLSGQVVATSGVGIAGATIVNAAEGASLAVSDVNGAYAFQSLCDGGSMRIVVSAPGHLPRETSIRSTTHQAKIDLISLSSPFSLDYYRQLARNSLATAGSFSPLRHVFASSDSINVYIRTHLIDPAANTDTGIPVPTEAVSRVLTAIPIVTSELTGGTKRIGVVETSPGAPPPQYSGQAGWLTIDFFHRDAQTPYAGFGGSGVARLGISNASDPFDCAPIPMGLIFHELGHAFGLFHTDDVDRPNMMHGGIGTTCTEAHFSSMERFHSQMMYKRPFGNADPDIDPPEFILPVQ